nr:transposase [Paenibacillus dendritiformis]
MRENIPFMWLAARQRPDFRTINRFRSERMKDVLEQIFTSILGFLVEENYVKPEHYFVDENRSQCQ